MNAKKIGFIVILSGMLCCAGNYFCLAQDKAVTKKQEAKLEETEQEDALPEEKVVPQEPFVQKQAVVQEPLQKKDKPKEISDNATAEAGLPAESVTRIYAFREAGGALNLTNNYLSIPKELHGKIEYISLFPVRFIAMNKEGTNLVLDVEGKQRELSLAGVKMPPKNTAQYLLSYIAQTIKNVPLRLKYNPSEAAQDGATLGRIYLRAGTYINLDMVRRGLAPFCPETISPDQHEEFMKAEELAKKKKAGIWGISQTRE
ncbi:MAG: thermonuclease family protein [Pseudomonadota bacterium]